MRQYARKIGRTKQHPNFLYLKFEALVFSNLRSVVLFALAGQTHMITLTALLLKYLYYIKSYNTCIIPNVILNFCGPLRPDITGLIERVMVKN
jgi:hypothetical protein